MKSRLLPAVVLAISFLTVSGCGPKPNEEEPDWFRSTSTGKNLTDQTLLTKIDSTYDLFTLYRMKRQYVMRGGKSQAIVKALDERRNEIVDAHDRQTAIPDKLDFIDWEIRRVADGSYEVSAYFVVTGKMDRDWRCKLVAKVDDSHVDKLPPDSRKEKRLRYKLTPETSTWEVGEHKILSHIFDFQPIPYKIFGVFSLYPEGTYGDMFEYGWFADPDLQPGPTQTGE